MMYSTISDQARKVPDKLQNQKEVDEGEIPINLMIEPDLRINAMEKPKKLHIEGESNEDDCLQKSHESNSCSQCEGVVEKLQSIGRGTVTKTQKEGLQIEVQELGVYDFATFVQVEPCYTYSRKKINKTHSRTRQESYANRTNDKTLTSIPVTEDLKVQSEEDVGGSKTDHLVVSDKVYSRCRKKVHVVRDLEAGVTDLCHHGLQEENLANSDDYFSRSRKRIHGVVPEIKHTGICEPVAIFTHESGEEKLGKTDGSRKRSHEMGSSGLGVTGVLEPLQVINPDYAAVASGLPPHSLSVAERIRFDNVLRQTDGLQKYLKHRNLILSLWQRNIHHTLSITDFGLNDAAAFSDDSNELHLLWDIYDFLNYHGFINAGFVSKKPKRCAEGEVALTPEESQSGEHTAEIGLGSPILALCSNDLASKTITRAKLQKKRGNQELDMVKAQKRSNNSTMIELCAETKGTENAIENPSVNPSLNMSGKVPDLCGDEESLLDIKNRIKARNRKNKQGVFEQVLSASGTKHSAGKEKDKFREPLVNGNGTVEDLRYLNSLERMGSAAAEVQKGEMGGIALHINLDTQVKQKKVIIVGAGPAGLAAGRHLQKMGVGVIILEAQKRVGGRAFTDYTSFSGPVDLGASIIRGVEPEVIMGRRPDPTVLLCKQLGLELAVLQHNLPVFDLITGAKVPEEIEKDVKVNYGSIIEQTAALISEHGTQMSIQQGIELVLRKQTYHRKNSGFPVNDAQKECIECDVSPEQQMANKQGSGIPVDDLLIGGKEGSPLAQRSINVHSLAQRFMEWHFANLEYACGGELINVSLPFYWNHVDIKCEFGGPHCMIKAGFGAVIEAFRDGLDIHMEQVVNAIIYKSEEENSTAGSQVEVQTEKMDVFIADAVLLTVPLGCLKSHSIKFSPPLPDWKAASIERLGFGLVNKVVMEFPAVFWDEQVDYFGATAEKSVYRGRCFMFSSLKRTLGLPILIALVAGKAAIEDEQKEVELVDYALTVLRMLYGEKRVPQPSAFRVTKWGSDPFSRGAYSYVTVGASEEDYDVLSLPVQNKVFFAGDATCREHPNSVGGAILSGTREAVRILDALHGIRDIISESKNIVTSERQLEMENEEVRTMLNMLENPDACTVMLRDNELFKRAGPMKETLASSKSNSRRLSVAQELLQLPGSFLRRVLGTNDGLLVLKDWIKDSMATNEIQLLRLCIHLLLMAGIDLSTVRKSGIGWIVKDVMRMQLSKDIHAGANQLLELWKGILDEEKNIAKHLRSSFNLQKKRLKQQKDCSNNVDACLSSLDSLCGPSMRMMAKKVNEELEQSSALKKAYEEQKKSPPSVDKSKTDVCRPSRKLVSNSNLGDQNKKEKNQKSIPSIAPVENTHIAPLCEDSFKLTSERPVQDAGIMQKEHPASEDVRKGGDTLGQTFEENTEISDLEAAALAAAEAADAAVKAFQTTEAVKSKLPELPRIVSFQKFAKRENVTESNKRRPLQRETLMLYGRDLITSGSDVRQRKVREWTIDFNENCSYLGGPDMLPLYESGINSRAGFSSAMPAMPGISGTDTAGEKHESCFTPYKEELLPIAKEIIDEGSVSSSIRGSHQRKPGICLSSLNSASTPVSSTLSVEVQKVDNKSTSDQRQFSDPEKSGEFISPNVEKWSNGSLPAVPKLEIVDGIHVNCNGAEDACSMRATFEGTAGQRIEEGSSGHALLDPEIHGDCSVGLQVINVQGGGNRSEDVRQAITDYVTRLLQPLYKTRRIDKGTFKSMLKKATTKVMERRTKEELAMRVAEFLDTKRKLKIRSLIDKLVERHLENMGK